jgi:integrase
VKQLRTICQTFGERPIDARDRAILLVGFASGWRRHEIASLCVADIGFVEEGVTLRLRRSKTDQEGRGRIVGIHFGEGLETCPVRALEAWMRVRGEAPGALFLRADPRGRITFHRIRPHTVASIVKRALERIGVDPARYAAHSLRAGFVTAAAARGASELSIMQRTGQRSIATGAEVRAPGASLSRESAEGRALTLVA